MLTPHSRQIPDSVCGGSAHSAIFPGFGIAKAQL